MEINIDELANELTKQLQEYSDTVTEGVKKAVDTTSDECMEEIKNHVTFERHKGDKYVKAFRIKTVYEDKYNKRNTWYVANGQASLTHLLENGHALRNGGRSRDFPHIKFGEELVIKRMEELAREAVENAGY